MSPILGPTTTGQTTIGDLANEVVLRCENRQQDLLRSYIWVRDALIEITTHTELRDDFTELEIWGPKFNLTTGTAEYDFTNFMPSGTDPLTGLPWQQVEICALSVLLWTDPSTNANRIQLDPSHYQDVDRASNLTGSQPSEWYRFGSMIGFNPIPNQNFQTQLRILRMHPIVDATLATTPILINRDWHECIIWAGVERGYMENKQFESAAAIHSLLHGDPKHPEKPGMLFGAKKKRKREAFRQTGALRPVIRNYGAR